MFPDFIKLSFFQFHIEEEYVLDRTIEPEIGEIEEFESDMFGIT